MKIIKIFYHFVFGVPLVLFQFFRERLAYRDVSDITDRSSIVSENVYKNGIHVFPDLIGREQVEAFLEDFESLKRKKGIGVNGQQKGRIYEHGIMTPLIGEQSSKIRALVQSILHTESVKVELSYYQESFPETSIDSIPGGEFHADDNKANVKYFIYLSDVTEDNGPFSCVPGTGTWKLRNSLIRGILWEITHERKYLYDFKVDHECCVDRERKITGPVGTHFLVDTTSLHRALPVKNGSRSVLVISFNRA